MQRAFRAAVADIIDKAQLTALRNALRAGNIEAAIEALNIEAAAYQTFVSEIQNTYVAAGETIAAGTVFRFPNLKRAVVRFNVTNRRAESWLQNVSTTRIQQRLLPDQVAAVRTTINSGYALGRHPNKIAIDLVGKVGANGKRTGGVIGLSNPQAEYVSNMRRYLTEDPKRALQMTRRDRRFDAAINKAVESGKPLTSAQIDRMTQRYSDRMLQLRGEGIARTETGMAVSTAKKETFKQYREKTGVPDQAIIKTWSHAGPAKNKGERKTHKDAHKTSVRGLDTPFNIGGVLMQYPLDPDAPASELNNCRCDYSITIDYAMLAV